jgi:hypothetical protein
VSKAAPSTTWACGCCGRRRSMRAPFVMPWHGTSRTTARQKLVM